MPSSLFVFAQPARCTTGLNIRRNALIPDTKAGFEMCIGISGVKPTLSSHARAVMIHGPCLRIEQYDGTDGNANQCPGNNPPATAPRTQTGKWRSHNLVDSRI